MNYNDKKSIKRMMEKNLKNVGKIEKNNELNYI